MDGWMDDGWVGGWMDDGWVDGWVVGGWMGGRWVVVHGSYLSVNVQ